MLSSTVAGAAGLTVRLSAGTWYGPWNVLYTHILRLPSSQVPPPFTDRGSGFQVVPVLELDLKESASTVCVVDLLLP